MASARSRILHDQLSGHVHKGVTFLMDGWRAFPTGFFSTQFAPIVTNETLTACCGVHSYY